MERAPRTVELRPGDPDFPLFPSRCLQRLPRSQDRFHLRCYPLCRHCRIWYPQDLVRFRTPPVWWRLFRPQGECYRPVRRRCCGWSFGSLRCRCPRHVSVQIDREAGGIISYHLLLLLFPFRYQLNLLRTPQLDISRLIALSFITAFYGLFFAMPLRKYYVLRQKLTFPSVDCSICLSHSPRRATETFLTHLLRRNSAHRHCIHHSLPPLCGYS